MIVKTNGYLEQYRQEIREGKIIAGLELIMMLDKLLEDMDDDRYIYDTTDADERMDFMENCVRLTKSPFYNKPMVLMLWQKAFISAVYGFKMAEDRLDRFKKVILLIARKNTKSEMSSAIALSEFFLGEEGNDIVCSSNDDNQASIVYDAIDMMRQLIDPKDLDSKRNQRFILNKATNTKCFKLSDKTRNKEGRNIGFGILDESHEMTTNVIAKSIEQSQSLKLNPKFINITTEGFVNGGYLDDELKKARKILRGEDDGLMAERTLPWLYTQDSEQEVWTDERSWYKSNPTLGIVKRWNYLREQVDVARESKADRAFVLSKDFNFKCSNSQAWLQESDYKYVSTFELEDFRNCACLGAVDLAETTDMTCAKILLMKHGDPTKYIHTMYFIPEAKLENSDDKMSGAKYQEWAKDGYITIARGHDIDLSIVADWFYKLYTDYGIRLYRCGYDQKFSRDWKTRMDYYGFEYDMIVQNAEVMSEPMKLVEAELKNRLINYNENPIDQWCLGNASMELDKRGRCMCVKIEGQPSRRIDGAVTLIILFAEYKQYRTEFNTLVERQSS